MSSLQYLRARSRYLHVSSHSGRCGIVAFGRARKSIAQPQTGKDTAKSIQTHDQRAAMADMELKIALSSSRYTVGVGLRTRSSGRGDSVGGSAGAGNPSIGMPDKSAKSPLLSTSSVGSSTDSSGSRRTLAVQRPPSTVKLGHRTAVTSPRASPRRSLGRVPNATAASPQASRSQTRPWQSSLAGSGSSATTAGGMSAKFQLRKRALRNGS